MSNSGIPPGRAGCLLCIVIDHRQSRWLGYVSRSKRLLLVIVEPPKTAGYVRICLCSTLGRSGLRIYTSWHLHSCWVRDRPAGSSMGAPFLDFERFTERASWAIPADVKLWDSPGQSRVLTLYSH